MGHNFVFANANTFTGTLTVNAGTLVLQAASAVADTVATTIASGATILLINSETIGSVAGAGSVSLGSHTLTLGDATNTELSGVVKGTGGITKQGAGTLTLAGTNTYSGPTQINDGTLSVTGSLNASAVTVANGAALMGTGSVASIESSGTVAPGSSIGTMTVQGNVTFQDNSTFDAEINPTQSDILSVDGGVTISNNVSLRVTPEVGTYSTRTYDIITTTNGITGSFSTPTVLNADRLNGGTLTAGVSGNNYVLSLTVPEGGDSNGTNGVDDSGGSDSGMFTPGADTVIFTGRQIMSDLDGFGADDIINFQGTGNQVAANIRNIETLEIGTNAGIEADLTIASGTQRVNSTRVFTNGTLVANGNLTSPTVTLMTGATLAGTGTINGTVTNQGTLAPGASPGILTVNGAITNEGDAARFAVDIDGPTPGTGAGFHDQVVVAGDPGGFTADGTLIPITRGITGDATNTFTPTLGDSFTIVTATGGVSGAFDTVTQPAAGSLADNTRFDVLYGDNAITLTVTPDVYAGLAGLAPNQQAAAGAVDAVRPPAGTNAGEDLETLYDALYTTGPGSIAAALDQLSGVVHADAVTAVRAGRRLIGDAVAARTAALRSGSLSTALAPAASFQIAGSLDGTSVATDRTASGLSAGDGSDGAFGLGTWGTLLGRYGKTNGDGNAAGYDALEGGVILGADHAVTEGLSLGVALSYLRTEVGIEGDGGETDVNSYGATVYGSVETGAWFAEASAHYGFADYDSRRPIRFGTTNAVDRTATGDSHGHDFGAAVGLGYAWDWHGGVIEPMASVRYDRVERAGFTEEGAGSLGLAVADETLETVRTSLGLRVARAYDLGDAIVEPEIRLRWDHDFLDQAADSRASLGGTAFQVAGTRSGRDAAVLGLGLTAQIDDRLQAHAGYDANLRRGAHSHAIAAGLRLVW